jgi:hypothetical protein
MISRTMTLMAHLGYEGCLECFGFVNATPDELRAVSSVKN